MLEPRPKIVVTIVPSTLALRPRPNRTSTLRPLADDSLRWEHSLVHDPRSATMITSAAFRMVVSASTYCRVTPTDLNSKSSSAMSSDKIHQGCPLHEFCIFLDTFRQHHEFSARDSVMSSALPSMESRKERAAGALY